eukprot:TRINITY_DN68817_c0_g1_i1.p1 TRINITY_DN68817_c0_g1~~TRINITY_DN68817_c0_g1_i1.p1  ORF type:complete len:178 (+),score=24.27 TRINITY_DN68817_c0_g1_i1:97-630(+)
MQALGRCPNHDNTAITHEMRKELAYLHDRSVEHPVYPPVYDEDMWEPRRGEHVTLRGIRRDRELNGAHAEVCGSTDDEGFVKVRMRCGDEDVYKRVQVDRLRPYMSKSLPQLQSVTGVSRHFPDVLKQGPPSAATASDCGRSIRSIRSIRSASSSAGTQRLGSSVFSRSSRTMLRSP